MSLSYALYGKCCSIYKIYMLNNYKIMQSNKESLVPFLIIFILFCRFFSLMDSPFAFFYANLKSILRQ